MCNHFSYYSARGSDLAIFLFSSPGRSPGRAIVLPPASALALALASASAAANSLTLKFLYVMGKALSGELSCPCDRSCCLKGFNYFEKNLLDYI